MNFTNPCQNERGVALVISLMFLAILAMLGTTAVVLTTTDMQIGANYKAHAQAFYDSDAGVNYVIAKMEAGLKAWPRTFTLPTSSTPAIPLISTFTVPSGFGFTYPSEITQISTDPDVYQFVSSGTGAQSSTASITVGVQRIPAIMFGAFGDEKVDLKSSSDIYAYSHTDNQSPDIATYPVGFKEGDGDAGSNVAVNLDKNSLVDGDIGLGEDASGTDASDVTGQGGFTGTDQDVSRVDPDPLGVVDGEYADKFTFYSNPANNDNASLAVVDPGGASITTTGVSLTIGPGATLTLKGKEGGSNFYWHDITVKSDFLYIETTNGPVNIYMTGAFEAKTTSQVINTTHASCSTNGATPETSSCACCDTANPPNYTCTRGAPSDFSIFANSTTATDEIVMGNSVEFSGLIYAPYIEIEMKNSAAIYGALMGKTVEMNNGATLFFDVDLKDKLASNDLKVISWRDDRMQ